MTPETPAVPPAPLRIGVISDTHGLLRPEALAALRAIDGIAHILHAGDVGDITILSTLAQIAPVTAIRGNIDTHGPCANLPATEVLELGGKLVYLPPLRTRPPNQNPNPPASRSSSSAATPTNPLITHTHGVLYLNPRQRRPPPLQTTHHRDPCWEITQDQIQARFLKT